ncbi:hypothetical protein D3C72_960440 [compost metagenome]
MNTYVGARFDWSDLNASVDPLPKLEIGQRGVLLCAPVDIDGPKLSTREHDRDQLNSALLLWDQVVYPTNRVIRFRSDDMVSLIQMGAVHEARISPKGSAAATPSLIAADQGYVFEKLLESSPSRWCLSRFNGAPMPKSGDLNTHAGALISLTSAIPIPRRDIPFEAILEFRQYRRDELLALRSHLDELAASISSAADSHAAYVAKIDQLDAAIANQIRVTEERFRTFNLLGLKIGFSISDAFRAGFATLASSTAIQLPLSAVAATSLGAATINGLSIDVEAPGYRRVEDNSPYQYIVHAHEELG